MNKLITLALVLTLSTHASGKPINITTPHLSLVINAEKGKTTQFMYFGSRLSERELASLPEPQNGRFDIYPAHGMNAPTPSALSCHHADGNMTTELEVTGTEQTAGLTTIHLRDTKYELYVDLKYRTHPDADMIECSADIINREEGTVTLTSFCSAMLPMRAGNVWMSHLYGAWGDEGQVAEEQLQPGEYVIRNDDGVRNSHTAHAEVMFSLDGRPRENTGDVIGAALCYPGNYKLSTVTDETDWHYFFAGIDEQNSYYHLHQGDTLSTPPLAITFSREGLSGASRNFHKWGREYMLCHGNQERMILLNSWEGVYLDIKEKVMYQMMGDIAAMGGELFVMDDGWFGQKYRRNKDNCALGDWVTDTSKLPNGIGGLLKEAKKLGIKFGIWLEPEMTNTVSELYEQHPDWVIKAPKRKPVQGRGGTQLVLDMGNPQVQDFVFNTIDRLMSKYPDIAYIKWDANMSIMNEGSQYLPMEEQSHLYINYHQGLHKVLQRIRDKYPDLIIQACASGGGRANWGVLPWFDEFWVSDNTDALQRIYMQWGTSYFFPAMAMASHISNAPNHQTFRTIPLKYRTDVAMSGRLGMEIQPKNMTDEEKEQCRKAIAEYKTVRPVIQLGDLYRLQSPYEKKGVASLMYVSEAKDKAVWFWWKTETFVNQHLPVIKMAGLDPNRMYKVHELDRIDNSPLYCEGQSYSGKYLMEKGLEMPATHKVDYNKRNSWASRVLELTAE